MSGKLDPPSLPQPAVAFDPSQNATPLPTFDHKTPYEWAAKAHEMEAGIKLISVALTEEQRAALGAVRMKYRPNEDLMVDEQLIAYSGQIFTKAVDVSDRQRRAVGAGEVHPHHPAPPRADNGFEHTWVAHFFNCLKRRFGRESHHDWGRWHAVLKQ